MGSPSTVAVQKAAMVLVAIALCVACERERPTQSGGTLAGAGSAAALIMLAQTGDEDLVIACHDQARDRTTLSTEPVACFLRGKEETTRSDGELIQLCRAISSLRLREDCVPLD